MFEAGGKQMKKKWLAAGSAIGLSTVVMLTTGFTALAANSGYDDYKAALKATKALKSVSVEAKAVLQDNGKVLTDAQGNLKVNLQSDAMSGNVKVSGASGAQSVDLFSQANQEVWKLGSNDTYYVKQDKPEREKQHDSQEGDSAWMNEQAETVIDSLVGNLKDYVSVNKQTDGTKQISMQLDNAQIPAVAQALAPMALKHLSGDHHGERAGHKTADKQDPEQLFNKNLSDLKGLALSQNIQIENITLNAVIDASNYIKQQQASITFSGKSADGTTHTVTVNLDVHLSGFNNTTPDAIDLTGKTVQQVKGDHGGHDQEND
jgi:hypothetical protein